MGMLGTALGVGTNLYGAHQAKKVANEQYRLEMEARQRAMDEAREYEQKLLQQAGYFDEPHVSEFRQVPNPEYGSVRGASPFVLRRKSDIYTQRDL
jgi:hypothetical protein